METFQPLNSFWFEKILEQCVGDTMVAKTRPLLITWLFCSYGISELYCFVLEGQLPGLPLSIWVQSHRQVGAWRC